MPVPKHLKRLRSLVGHELLLAPAASVLPLDGAGRVLLARHVDDGESWGVLGGAIEPGESPTEAAIREVREEAGITVELMDLLGAVGGREFEVTYADGDKTAYVISLYSARIVDGEPRPDQDEISELRWFSNQELAEVPLSRVAMALLRTAKMLPADR